MSHYEIQKPYVMLVGCWKKDSSAASPLGATAGLPAVVCRHVQALLGKPAVALYAVNRMGV